MKKITILTTLILILIAGTGISYILWRNGLLTKEQRESREQYEKRMESLMVPGQEGEADEASAAFSKLMKEKAGLTVDPRNIVSVGRPITSGKYSFTVSSWSASKESPGYKLPEGLDLSDGGLQLDENGNITNEFSYVVLNMTVENMADEPVTDYLWGYMSLQAFDMGEYISEVRYLGEKAPRKYGHDSYVESFEAGETKSYPVVFLMPDEILEDQELYLEIDTSGGNPQPSDPEFSVKRFIILNERVSG